jgi:hypothetical protein
MSEKLKEVARVLLAKVKGGIDQAVPLFTAAVLKDRGLLDDLAAAYLSTVVLPRPKDKPSRRREGAHRRPNRRLVPTQEQKSAARRVVRAEASLTIWNRKLRGGRTLGDLHVNELRAYAEDAANTATSFLNRGFDDAWEAIALTMLNNHCVAADPFASVKDTVKTATATDIFESARICAAEQIRDASARTARELLARAADQPSIAP